MLNFKQHRTRLFAFLKQQKLQNSIVYLESGHNPEEKYTGCEQSFEFDGSFYWLTGWTKPDSAVILDVAHETTSLLTPKYDNAYAIWHGHIPKIDEIIAQTQVDEVLSGADFSRTLKSKSKKKTILTDDYDYLALIGLRSIDGKSLITALSICRRLKFADEIEALRRAAEITSDAVVQTMKSIRPHISEKVVEANFLFHGTCLGGSHLSFPTIAASGRNCAYLHYMENTKTIEENDLILLDCGMRYKGYCGDVTRTFPASGKFTDEQKLVYRELYELQVKLIDMLGPGVNMKEMENEMNMGIFEILKKVGICDGEYSPDISSLFVPHSLTHHLGTSEHDLVWFPDTSKIDSQKSAFFALVPGMVITIEPGIYFNEFMIKERGQKLRLNVDRALELAQKVGGIRIEDDVAITEDGKTVLSTCPKSIEAIEAVMSHT